ncbi:hypothetical protein [Streptomyces sp. RFCAC02]|uniref:hypothetical protein n=1 Tax=Streptomyces sp. RFCAC02 TaxID=2499143 RepID=UPI0019D1AD8B|nr:hypothetical protein [Streptomyces sp. RFCAC02]
MRTPLSGEVYIDYGQIYVESDFESSGLVMEDAFAGQEQGLCGAGTPGGLFLLTGLDCGTVGFTVEVHDSEPPLAGLREEWEEIVEVSFRPLGSRTVLAEWGGGNTHGLGLAETDHRVRYCASGMDLSRTPGTGTEDARAELYLLQFWPAPPAPQRVVKETSEQAAYWHAWARELPPPPPPAPVGRAAGEEEERHAAKGLRRHQEMLQRAELQRWGGREPSQTLRRAKNSNVLGVLEFDSALVHALDAAGTGGQRAVARLAAHRACAEAGLTGVDWIAAALDALDGDRPLPPPFDDWGRAFQRLGSDPAVPDRAVGRPVPPPPPPAAPAQRIEERPEESVSRPAADAAPPSDPMGEKLRAAGWTFAGTVRLDEPAPPKPVVVTEAVVVTTGTPVPDGPVSQPHMALPAVFAAARDNPLAAALDAVHAAIHTYGEDWQRLTGEIWALLRAAPADPA